jgi:DNA-binding CsgD family transcriptional regulator
MPVLPRQRSKPDVSSTVTLRGRDRELGAVQDLLVGARMGRGGALMVTADAGLGKSSLLNAMCAAASGCQILGTSGTEVESGLAAAGLHRLLRPVAERAATLPPHQADILATVLGAKPGTVQDGFPLCAAVHQLLADAGRQRPLFCWIDDVHWLDPTSLRTLAFVARRADVEPVVMVFAGRGPRGDDPLADLPRLRLAALDNSASREVLGDQVADGCPADLSAELIELASGNPLALVELAASLTPEQLSGVAPAPSSLPPHSRQRGTIAREFHRLSAEARRLVMMAVVDEQLELDAVLRTVDAGVELRALDEATASGLVCVDGEAVTVPTRLVRAVLYAEASLVERHAAHALLATVLDREQDRLRWTWHRVATTGVSRGHLADEFGRAAVVARRSGDYVESSMAFQRAAALASQPKAKARRLVEAAVDSWLTGRTSRSRALLRQARPPAGATQTNGLADLLHGVIELRDGAPVMAGQSLRAAAEQLVEHDRGRAVSALVLAGEASCVIGDYDGYFTTARRVAALRGPNEDPADELVFNHFEGMSATYEGRHDKAVRPLRRVLQLADTVDDVTGKILASQAAYSLGDLMRCSELATHAVNGARTKGLVTLVPWALVYQSMSALLLDQHSAAVASSLDGLRESLAIGQQNSAVDHLAILALLAALQGDRATAQLRLDAASEWAAARGLGRPSSLSSWALACVDLADDHPADAMDRLRLMAAGAGRVHLVIRAMAAPHFVEAASRCGQREPAARALGMFDRWVSRSDCAPRLALSHRCHALLAEEDGEAQEHFREAIRLHRSSETALELAKTELFYAGQLRRGRKPSAARELLRDAVKIFHNYDAELWVDRATAELRAAGESVRSTTPLLRGDLTPQQLTISRLVADGATNREIATQLILSHRTVDHHLRNIFTKLNVRSRVELAALFR